MIHLDTSFLVTALVRGSGPARRLRAWLSRGEVIGMSVIGWAELLCGPIDHGQLELVNLVVPRRLPFTEDDATVAARLFNESGRRRGSLADCMIAATALREAAALATENIADFRRFAGSGLRIAGD